MNTLIHYKNIVYISTTQFIDKIELKDKVLYGYNKDVV